MSCRPQVKDYVREHHFYEKAFVKETRFTGKEQQAGTGESEQLSCEERVVEATPAAPPCQVSSWGLAFLEPPCCVTSFCLHAGAGSLIRS